MKKVTVKKIREWLKTLEENRYKKIVNADARRIAWFVNNSLSEDYDSIPESMRKKWIKAEYKKERYMANKYLESLKQNESFRLKEGKGHEIELFWQGLKGKDAEIGRFIVQSRVYDKLENNLYGHVSIDLYDDKAVGKVSSYNDVIKALKKTKYGKIAFKENIENKVRRLIRKEIKEGFAGALKKEDRKQFDNTRRKQSEVLGYKLTGKDDLRADIGDALRESKLIAIIRDVVKEVEDEKKQPPKTDKSDDGKKLKIDIPDDPFIDDDEKDKDFVKKIKSVK